MKKLLSWLMALMIALVPLLAVAENTEDELSTAYQAAMKLYEEQKIEEAFAQLLVLAEKGYAEAMYSIGNIYFAGKLADGVPDYQLAKEWYLKAAEAGNAAAMFALASDYEKGYYTDGAPDYQLAKEWYLRAAEAGDARAAYMMGYHYEQGSFTGAPDYEEAMTWWLKAAEQKQPNALYAIGHYYAHDAKPLDFEKARVWLERAAEAGYIAAGASLGHHYYSGDFTGGTPDYANALAWYENAVAQGYKSYSIVYDRLGWIYAGNSDAMEADYVKALDAYTAGAALGSSYSMERIGELYYDGKLGEVNHAMTREWYEKAAQAGSTSTMVYDILGWIYAGNSDQGVYWFVGEEQHVCEIDYQRSLENYMIGATLGSGYSMAQIGALYRDGHLGDADKETAALWFSKAIEAGYADAQAMLDALAE